jgi:UDP-N-acetylbacillosamine N-acetyltransferase
MKEVNIIGSGGHARSVIPLLIDQGISVLGVYDSSFKDFPNEVIYKDIKLLGVEADSKNVSVLAIGDNELRKNAFNSDLNTLKDNIVHSSALCDETVEFGESNLVFTKAFINGNAVIGSNNIINTSAIIEHEVQIGDHNHIAVSATICGRVKIGSLCTIGANSTIIDQISICDNVTIGAGATVVSDITEPGIYVGTPAKKIK